jgi:regulatory protein
LKPKPEPTETDIRLAAMDLLARREQSASELTRKLLARGFADTAVAGVLQTLSAEGLQSDARFAETFVYARIQRGSGPAKIRAELRERGVAEQLIGDCMEACAGEWLERLRELREKKFGPGLPVDFRERGRQTRFLQQRGFSLEQIARVLRDNE